MVWRDVVLAMLSGYDVLMEWCGKLLHFFGTPFSDLIHNDSGVTSWITETVSRVLELFGFDFMNLTPLDFALGSVIPVVIVFTIYRYVKQ